MKIRLWATPEELAAATASLQPASRCTLTLRVLQVSPPYQDRGTSALARVYLEADEVASGPAAVPAAPPAPASAPTRPKPLRPASGIPLEVPKDGEPR